ncbi:hypothetical protein [Streptomyces sp. ALI-76-A]|uniref:hypothetical protein n=1 Tax=Streptomyces sp. ALI-76-A TaxID=3025736 RepID=UPI00256F2183|nr:hypothetical protein [Streptomyces sp. ALI-76-A]MDL5203275.1 hypothetical protein [Streptomyces sp. ALI-76-A]
MTLGVPVIGVVVTSADGKYAPVDNGQDALVFVAVFAVIVAVLCVVLRARRK